jgi:membrane protein
MDMKDFAQLLFSIFKGLERKHLQLVAAGLAYYFLMSLFPGLILLTAIAAYLPIQNGVQQATSFMGHVIPRRSLALVEPILKEVTIYRSGLLWFGIITSLWLTSVGAKAIIAGLDIVYEVHTPRSLWMNRFIAFMFTVGIGVLLLFGVILTVAGPFIETLLANAVSVQNLWIRVWPYLQWLLAGTFTFTAIEGLYLLAPNLPRDRRRTVPGALVATMAWLALSWGLGVFFHEFTSSKLDAMYGIFATPIALLTWLKWGAAGVLIGAELNVNLQSLKRAKKANGGLETLRAHRMRHAKL